MAAVIVQTAHVTEASGPDTVLVMPSNVTSGNLLVVMTGHEGGDECMSGVNAVYTDTRGLTFTPVATKENSNGGQSNSCIITAPITSSGPETITRTKSSSNYPVDMWAAEIGGITSPTVLSTNGGTADGGNTVSSGLFGSAGEGAIPVMTSNTAPSGVASASESWSGGATPWSVFNPSTEGWFTNGSALPQWIQYQFAVPITIVQYCIVPWSYDTFPSRSPTSWVLAGSNDGSTWTTLDTQTSYTSWTRYVPSTFPVVGASAYSYYRLTMSANGGNTYTGIKQLQVYTGLPNNCLLLGAGSDNSSNPYDGASPSGGTITFVSGHGVFLAKFVPAGAYNCTFTKTAGGVRFSAVAALIGFIPTAEPVSTTVSATCSIVIAPAFGTPTGIWLDLWVWRQLWHLDALTDTVSFLPVYRRALVMGLARELCREYGRDPAVVEGQANQAMAELENSNQSIRTEGVKDLEQS